MGLACKVRCGADANTERRDASRSYRNRYPPGFANSFPPVRDLNLSVATIRESRLAEGKRLFILFQMVVPEASSLWVGAERTGDQASAPSWPSLLRGARQVKLAPRAIVGQLLTVPARLYTKRNHSMIER